MARMAQSFNSFCFSVTRHEQMPQLPKEACISVQDGIKLNSVEQYLDLAGFHFGAETSQLMGFSARPLAGLSCAGFPIKVARLRMLREVMRWCSSFLYPLLPCLVWHSFQFWLDRLRSLQSRTLILILLLTLGMAGVVEGLVQSHRYRTRGSRVG